MTHIFMIDGEGFDVLTASIKRNFKIGEGPNSGESISGRRRRDIRGTYYNYTLEIDPSLMARDDYDRMYEILSAPVESHTITVPYGQSALTYEAEITGGEDEVSAMEGNDIIDWGELTVTFNAIKPQRSAI